MTRLERVDWVEGVHPPCPTCGVPTTGLHEAEAARDASGRRPDHVPILVIAEPCGCEVTDHAAVLQHDAILLEHELAMRHGPPAR